MHLYRRFFATALAIGAGAVFTGQLAGCVADDKAERDKGVVDTSLPPGDPGKPDSIGKADAGDYLAAVSVESPHPYSNYMDREFPVDLSALPHCAYRAQLHFAVARVEQGYDYLHVTASGDDQVQTLTGNHDGEWTDWFYLDQSNKQMTVRLESDYSITDHGFEIDQVKYQGAPICPAVVWPPCGAGEVNINPPPGVCDCPAQPTCVPTADIEVQRQVFRGFDNKGKLVVGHDAFTTAPGPADGLEQTNVGTVDEDALLAFISRAAASGLLHSSGYDSSGEWNEYFRIEAGRTEVVFRAPLGEHTPEVKALIDEFLALFDCDTGDLTCGNDYVCEEGDCVEDEGCFCTQQYDPVCGVNGRTYGNACMAGCANVGIKHDGECGIEGDMCGGLLGLTCADGFKCRMGEGLYTAPYPDAAGTCVPFDYCDAPPDCAGLIHPATVGQWACVENSCTWQEGAFWQQVTGWQFETAHPYANNASAWKQLYLPAGATEMRLSMVGVFELEEGYDFLEVWTWDGSWRKVATYTGLVGPSASETFPGQYHYLHFVSDPYVTGEGFNLIAEYR